MKTLSALILFMAIVPFSNGDNFDIDIRMTGAIPHKDDSYLCYSEPVIYNSTQYFVKFTSLADVNIAHHMILFHCAEAAIPSFTISECHRVCESPVHSTILYAWGNNGPPVNLPPGVGFEITRGYLVLQIHYLHKTDKKDFSGVSIQSTSERQENQAGMILMYAMEGEIPAHQKKAHINISCLYSGPDISPFAFRVHAHSLGIVNTAYVYINQSYHLIAKGMPQKPQAFFPLTTIKHIRNGDKLIVQCTYDSSSRSNTTLIGATHTDEMCNFYIMFYTNLKNVKMFQSCNTDVYGKLSANLPSGSDEIPKSEKFKNLQILSKLDYWSYESVEITRRRKRAAAPKLMSHRRKPGHSSTANHRKSLTPRLDIKEQVDWFKASREHENYEISAIDTDSTNRLFVFHRAHRKWKKDTFDYRNVFQDIDQGPIMEYCILVFDERGSLVDNMAKEIFFFPHGLSIDENDNIWLTDIALHQVFRIPRGARYPDLILGEKFKPGNAEGLFCQPTSVAVSSGDVFISDGYCNDRIVQYNTDGTYINYYGDGRFNLEFNLPHDVVSLSQDRKGICVADRINARIQCYNPVFDTNHSYKTTASEIKSELFNGSVYSLAYSPKSDYMFAINGPAYPAREVTEKSFLVDLSSARVVQSFTPKHKNFSLLHSIAVSRDGSSVYIAEFGIHQIYKFSVSKKSTHKTIKKVLTISPTSSISTSSPPTPLALTTPPSRTSTSDATPIFPQTIPDLAASTHNQVNVTTPSNTGGFELVNVKASLLIGSLVFVPVIVVACALIICRIRHRVRNKFNKGIDMGQFLTSRRHFGNGFRPVNQFGSDTDSDDMRGTFARRSGNFSDSSADEMDEFIATSRRL